MLDLLAYLINVLVISLISVIILIPVNLLFGLAVLKLVSVYVKKTSRSKFKLDNENIDKLREENSYFTIGFFHPFCNSGGGGERVLWSAVKAIQDTYPNCVCVIYTGDIGTRPEEIIKNANERLAIELNPACTKFVYLRLRFLVLDKYYPMFTLLGQSLGSVLLGVEAMCKFIPDIYFETTGYAFTYPLFRYVGNTPVGCYTHYPTISSDMLSRVHSKNPAFNNRSLIARSRLLTQLKLVYYRVFARVYGVCGRCACCVMVNSSWTQAHINEIFSLAYHTKIVYPPCDVQKFDAIFASKKHDENFFIASVAQIRPEKNHQLQIRALAKFLNKLKESRNESEVNKVKLLIIGSCRNEEDTQRAADLKKLSVELNVEKNVEFYLNFKFESLLERLSESAVGIHTMIDEHFGIGVVECMASGLIMLAHNSAGPKMDIVVPYKGERSGFLAESEEEYSVCLNAIYSMSGEKRAAIRNAAREQVKKFSQQQFNIEFIDTFAEFCFSNLNKKSD